MATLEDLTYKDSAADAQAADSKKRAAARQPKLPKASAWMTWQQVLAKVRARAESKKRVLNETRDKAWQLFRRGMEADHVDEAELKGQQRQSAITKAVRLLEEDTFAARFQAFSLLATARVGLAEARKAKVAHLVQACRDAEESPAPLRCLCGKLLKAWQKEKAEA